MELKLKFYSDPGHGWLAVKRRALTDLGIADKISVFSYTRGDTVYLEEDCDAYVLVKAFKARGVTVKFDYRSTDRTSPIRSYDRYRAV